MTQKLTLLATDTELRTENYCNELMETIISSTMPLLVSRGPVNKAKAPLAVAYSTGSKFLIDYQDFSNIERLRLLKKLVTQAKQGQLQFLAAHEITNKAVELQAKNKRKFIFAHEVTNDDLQKIAHVQGQAKVPIMLVSHDKSFSQYWLLLRDRRFVVIFKKNSTNMRMILGEEIMEPATLTVRAIVGALKIPIEDLIRLRTGSSFSLGNITSLEAIFEVEGNPYATGAVQIRDDGSVSMEVNDIL